MLAWDYASYTGGAAIGIVFPHLHSAVEIEVLKVALDVFHTIERQTRNAMGPESRMCRGLQVDIRSHQFLAIWAQNL